MIVFLICSIAVFRVPLVYSLHSALEVLVIMQCRPTSLYKSTLCDNAVINARDFVVTSLPVNDVCS